MLKKRIKKLLVIGPLPPPLAGPEIVTNNIISSDIIAEHYLITHVNTTVRKSNSEKGTISFLAVIKLLKYFINLLKQIVFNRPTYVLYLPTSATKIGWVRDGVTIMLCRILNIKSIVLFQGGHFRYFFDSLGNYQKKIIKAIINQAYLILTQSESLKRQFNGIIPIEKIALLYNSLNKEFVDAFDDSDLDQRKTRSELNILFVGHLSVAKGYCDLLKVISEIENDFTVKFNFMGVAIENEKNVFYNQVTGSKINIISQKKCYKDYIINNRLENQVNFLGGQVHGQDKINAFKEADIFISPSYSEGFSTAILEAMAAGLPLIVTKVGMVPDILEENTNAKLILPGDHDGIKNSLTELITNPKLRKQMGINNRKKCKENFLVEHSSQQLLELLENIDS